jgi:hypothetical protein
MTLNINYAKNKGFNCPIAAPAFAPIGSVGTAGQMAAGHVLTNSSFPSAAIGSNLSYYHLTADGSDASANGRTLTATASPLWNGTDILGTAGCLVLNGSSQYLSGPNDAHFNPGNVDWSAGGWFYANWATMNATLFSNFVYTGNSYRSFQLNSQTTVFVIEGSTNGSSQSANALSMPPLAPFGTTWLFIELKYIAAITTFMVYVNSKLWGQITLTGALYTVPVNTNFKLGSRDNGTDYFFNGKIDEFFFARYAMADNDIAKIYARKYSHNQNIAPVSQKWIMQAQSSGGQTRELLDNIVDQTANDLYYDLSGEASTTQVSLRLANIY